MRLFGGAFARVEVPGLALCGADNAGEFAHGVYGLQALLCAGLYECLRGCVSGGAHAGLCV